MFPIYAVVTLISSAWLFLTPIQREKVEGETSSFPATLKLLGDNKILLLFFGILCVVGLDVGMNTLTRNCYSNEFRGFLPKVQDTVQVGILLHVR